MRINHIKKSMSLILAGVMLLSLAVPSLHAKAKGTSIDNTDAYYAIQSKVTLTGTGSGYHAKLAYVARGAAISYGIQHDEFASAQVDEPAIRVAEAMARRKSGTCYVLEGSRLVGVVTLPAFLKMVFRD